MSEIKLEVEGLYSNDRGGTIHKEGFSSKVSMLGEVCTGRMVQGLHSNSPAGVRKELEWWIKLLNEGKKLIQGMECRYIAFKPQMLVAVTNASQTHANKALLQVGFVPSPPVLNKKYGPGYELTTWTYALNGFHEEVDVQCAD